MKTFQVEEIANLVEELNVWRHFFTKGPILEVLQAINNLLHAYQELDENEKRLLDQLKAINMNSLDLTWLDQIKADFTRVVYGPDKLTFYPFESVAISGDKQLMQQETYEIRKTYLESGLAVKALDRIPDDFIANEIEFAFYLLQNTLKQYQQGKVESAAQELEKFHLFFDQHIQPWIPDFCHHASSQCQDSLIADIFRLIEGSLTNIGDMLKLRLA